MLCLWCAFRLWHMHTEMTGNALKVSFFLSHQLCVFVFVDLIVYRCCQGDSRWLSRSPFVLEECGLDVERESATSPSLFVCSLTFRALRSPSQFGSFVCCLVCRRVNSENCNCNYRAHHWVSAFLRNSWWVMQCCSSTRLRPIDPSVWVSGPLRSFLLITLSELTVIWRRQQQRGDTLTVYVFQDVHISHQTQKWEWCSDPLTSEHGLAKWGPFLY